MVQYSFKGGIEHSVEPAPHGNSRKKGTQQYVRTWDSTKKDLIEESESKHPREAIHSVIDKAWRRIQTCVGLGQIPRNRQQAKDLIRNRTMPNSREMGFKNISGLGKLNDPWYCLLNESKTQARNKNTAFIRDVRVGAEPLSVLASERQLNDLQRFCCNVNKFQPLTVDPTFNIGEFNVTPISYQNLLMHTKQEKKHPTIIGPVLLHEKKTKETYSLFCGVLKALKPALNDLLAFGTDDEEPLANAFDENFQRSTHLLCSIHMLKNVESRLVEMGITGKVKKEITDDIFGRQNGDIYEKGLCDAADAEQFEKQMVILKTKWASSHKNGQTFFKWFEKNKREKFINSLISPVRQRAGLGCPPSKFTTNRSERTNGVIQDYVARKCGRRRVDVYSFAVMLKELVDIQEKEVELAVVGKGKYTLHPAYEGMRVTASQWVKMTYDQQQAALRKIHSCTVEDISRTDVSTVTAAVSDVNNPILKAILKAGVDWIPPDSLAMTADKAAKLDNDGTTVSLPSVSTIDTFIVPSKSDPKKPHVVNLFPNGKCECDNCPAYKASFICAHVIVACLKKSRLVDFLRWLVTSKRKTGGVNYSEAVSFGMPKGRGRKGEAASGSLSSSL